jgi:RecA-family ATPase
MATQLEWRGSVPRISAETDAAKNPPRQKRVNGRDSANSIPTAEERPLRDVPHNIDSEQALLGAILINNDAMERVSDFLDAEHFYDPLHQQIYDTSAKLIASGKQATPITLRTFFETAEPIDAGLTVPQYLGRLAAHAATIINARDYGCTIYELATRRQLILIGEDVVNTAYDSPVDFPVDDQIAEMELRLRSLREADIDRPGPPLLVASALADKAPPRKWHVQGWVPGGSVTLLGGDGGTGKSLLALQLAACTVLGNQWLGQTVARGPVLYLTAEDDVDEMHRRIVAVARHLGVPLDRLSDLHILCLAGEDAILAITDRRNVVQPTKLWRKHCRSVAKLKPSLIVYDTLADLFAGDENSRVEARQFVSLLRGLSLKSNSSGLLLNHPSLSGMSSGAGTSGSTGWSNSVRSRLYLNRVKDKENNVEVEADPNARVLRVMKANYGATGEEIHLRWHDGVFDVRDPSKDDAMPTGKQLVAENLFLSLLQSYFDEGRFVNAMPCPTYAPSVFARDQRTKGTGKKLLEDAMNRLLVAGRIKVEQYGRDSKRRSRLVAA